MEGNNWAPEDHPDNLNEVSAMFVVDCALGTVTLVVVIHAVPTHLEIIIISVLPKGRSSIANSGTKVVGLLGINRYSSFPLLSAPHYLFSILTDLKRSEKIPGAPLWR